MQHLFFSLTTIYLFHLLCLYVPKYMYSSFFSFFLSIKLIQLLFLLM